MTEDEYIDTMTDLFYIAEYAQAIRQGIEKSRSFAGLNAIGIVGIDRIAALSAKVLARYERYRDESFE